MVRPGAQRRDHLGAARCVAEPYGQIAEPPLVADAADRRAAQALVELGLGPPEKLDHRRVIEAIARREILLRRGLREAVPGADKLAVVATVDAVANQRPQLFRYGALVLDRQIRDAATGIELVRTGDGLRRADVDAALAGAAVLADRFIDRQREIGIDLAEEEP